MNTRDKLQFVWGLALIMMGTAFFFRIPYVLDRVFVSGHAGILHVFIRVCMFCVSIILIGGGVKKIAHIRRVFTDHSGDNLS